MSADENCQSGGWLVEVLVPRMHATEREQRLFAAAIAEDQAAAMAVRKSLGGLHCVVEAKCRLSVRALLRLGVPQGKVVPMRSGSERT